MKPTPYTGWMANLTRKQMREVTESPSLLSSEQRIVDDFGHQTRGVQEQILSAAIRDPQASGALVNALRAAVKATGGTK